MSGYRSHWWEWRNAARRIALVLMLFQVFAVNAAEQTAVFKADVSGDAVCTGCHGADSKQPILSFHQTRHGVAGQPGCQACHGSSRAHVQHEEKAGARPPADFVFKGEHRSSADIQSRTCLNCHKGGQRIHWVSSTHPEADVACPACHTIHRPQDPALNRASQPEVCFRCHVSQRAQQHFRTAHSMLRSGVACSDCHNPHGGIGPALLRTANVNQTCFTCHADKRGPFLWEHPPAVDDCTNCHTPHGSNIAPLLKVRPPWLCQSCHGGSIHTSPAFSGRGLPAGGATSPQLLLHACTNCHSAIHGSNHPSGARFTR